MNRNQSITPVVIGLILVFLFAAWVDPCDNAPDCRAKTARIK